MTSETVSKWVSEFSIEDDELEPLTFVLLRDYLLSFNKCKSDYTTDKRNGDIIDDRVISLTADIQSDLSELIIERDVLIGKCDVLRSSCNDLHTDISTLKVSRQCDISNAISDTKESNNEVKDLLREEITSLRSENSSLVTERETILTRLIPSTDNKTSYETGVEGENEMSLILSSGNWDEIIDSHSTDHAGDFIVKYRGNKYIIDVKNYQSNIPGQEVRKLAKDIEGNNCDGGAIISFNSGIINPNTNCVTKENMDKILVMGKNILLLSNASSIPAEFINSAITSLKWNSPSDTHQVIDNNVKQEISASIIKMEKEIISEKKNFQARIIKKQHDLENLKLTLIVIVGEFDDQVNDEIPNKPSKISVPEMRKRLIDDGYDDEANLKNKSLGLKYKEIYNDLIPI